MFSFPSLYTYSGVVVIIYDVHDQWRINHGAIGARAQAPELQGPPKLSTTHNL